MNRGDIFHVDLNPIKGHEQAGRRFVLIVSATAFNMATKLPVVCPITGGGGFVRNAGFAVSLSGAGTETTGVIRCDQPRVLDLVARNARKVEVVPDFIIEEVLARLVPIFE
jgi:mRNA-degrading endonuclease toxin of MazEF toxin-antitoxin module